MKILYILRQEPDKTLTEIMEIHRITHEVNVIDIRENKNYAQIIELIENNDKVISW